MRKETCIQLPSQMREMCIHLYGFVIFNETFLDEIKKKTCQVNIIWTNSRNFMLIVVCFCFPRILNKLTPDKFEKLCHELIGVGIETKYILKGVILLVS